MSENEFYLIHFFIGPFALIFSIVYRYIFPPKKINRFYGYRTDFSKRNIEVWKEANRYAAGLMILVSMLVVVLQFYLIFIYKASTHVSLLFPIFVLSMGMTTILAFTENHLSKKFDKDGNKREKTI